MPAGRHPRRRGPRGRLAATVLALAATAIGRTGRAQGRLSEHAVAAQTIAGTTITVEYYRPVARGRDSLFGGVVTWGEHWTPGANWATTLEVDHDVRVNGARLPQGKYGLWTVVRPDQWTVEFHPRWRKFHLPPPDSGDALLHFTVRPDSGPPVEVLTFDFPEVRPAATTLRFRWGRVIVPLTIEAIPPPVALLRAPADAAPYLGRYDLRIVMDAPGVTRRRVLVDIVQSGDTLRWRDADGPADERREFILSPADEDEFSRARRSPSGEYWPDQGTAVAFTMKGGRATGFEVRLENGGTASRATRVR
ncbi:MAG TPA: DUF2911 domain-containing protein [Gemmatimonadales bacterium]|nr:DUF2911 domain-containing protein [Gemmatimonadales bacterium]